MKRPLAIATAFLCHPLVLYADPDPISRWSADGTAADLVGGNHGVFLGTPSFVAGIVPGNGGEAFDFNGIDAEVSVAEPQNFDFSQGLTVTGWLRTSGSADFSGLIDKFIQGPQTTGFQISLSGTSAFPPNQPGILRADLGVGGDYVTAFNLTRIDDGLPHHFALTCDAERAILYVDGEPGLSVRTVGWLPHNSEGLVLGRDTAGANRHFRGQIDDVSIYTQVLTSREIKIVAGHPILDIAPADPGFVKLFWPKSSFDFMLQYNDTLAPANWKDVTDGSQSPLIFPVTPATRFFRLVRP